jgi:hypothetical protein
MNDDILHLSFTIPEDDYSLPLIDLFPCECETNTAECLKHSGESYEEN